MLRPGVGYVRIQANNQKLVVVNLGRSLQRPAVAGPLGGEVLQSGLHRGYFGVCQWPVGLINPDAGRIG